MKIKTDDEIREEIAGLRREWLSVGQELIECAHKLRAARISIPQQVCKHGPQIEFKRAPDSTTTISGYASTFNFVDLAKESVSPGAFSETLAKHRAAGTKPVMLWAHNMDELIGVWDEIREDAHGLWVKGHLLTTVQRGAEAAALVAADAINGLSIGYRVLRDEIDSVTGVRRLLKLQLFEISLVGIPANVQARLNADKEYSGDDIQHAVERLTRAARSFGRAVSWT